jgi:hypothetical protein
MKIFLIYLIMLIGITIYFQTIFPITKYEKSTILKDEVQIKKKVKKLFNDKKESKNYINLYKKKGI